MDTNYIIGREQQSIRLARTSTSQSARAVHRAFATAYGRLLGKRDLPLRHDVAEAPVAHRERAPASEEAIGGWENEGGHVEALEPSVALELMTRTGVRIHVRPALISDEAALTDFFNALSAEDLRFRFGGTSRVIEPETVRPLLNTGRSDCITFLAIVNDRGIVAASTLADVPRTTNAEVALSVHPLWKAHGIAWTLLDHTLGYATTHGLEHVTSYESGDERLAINLEHEMGFVARLISASPVELALTKNVSAR